MARRLVADHFGDRLRPDGCKELFQKQEIERLVPQGEGQVSLEVILRGVFAIDDAPAVLGADRVEHRFPGDRAGIGDRHSQSVLSHQRGDTDRRRLR
ncbi:hypothetical protein D3C71_1594560 [compost metagenome]